MKKIKALDANALQKSGVSDCRECMEKTYTSS